MKAPLFIPLVLSAVLSVSCLSAEDGLFQEAIKTAFADNSLLLNLVNTSTGKLAFGEHGLIVEIDNEHKWQQHSVPINKTLTASTSFSDGTLLAVGHEGTILRKKMGLNWQVAYTGHQLLTLKKQMFERNIIQLKQHIASTTDEDIIDELSFRLEDVEYSLNELAAEFITGAVNPFLAIKAIDDNKALVLGAYGTMLFTKDQGNTWLLIDGVLDNPERFHLNSVVSDSNESVFIFGEAGIAFRSLDLGKNWQKLNLPYEGSLFGSEVSRDGKFVVAYGLKGNILISTDGGENWRHIKTTSGSSLLGSDLDQQENAWLVGHAGSVVKINKNDLSLTTFKHPTGDIFADIIVENNDITLVGQNGVVHWAIQP